MRQPIQRCLSGHGDKGSLTSAMLSWVLVFSSTSAIRPQIHSLSLQPDPEARWTLATTINRMFPIRRTHEFPSSNLSLTTITNKSSLWVASACPTTNAPTCFHSPSHPGNRVREIASVAVRRASIKGSITPSASRKPTTLPSTLRCATSATS